MRHILVIGIGAGDPDYLTLQAVKAVARADVFLLVDKGREKQDLADLRQTVLERHAPQPHRIVEVRDPERERPAEQSAYTGAVEDWRRRRAGLYERALRDELADGECGAFLVWGDPALYDSTLAALEEVLAHGEVEFTYEVVPGISAVSALAARHRTALNRVGGPVQITTGRRLAEEGVPEGVDDLVVMLDAQQAFTRLDGGADGHGEPAGDAAGESEWRIHWGAYVGTDDELLVSGPLREVAGEIEETRAAARERKGWIMDTYLLRRHRG